MIKAIAFDFGGVFVDTYEYHYQIYAQKYKHLSREKHRWLFEANVLERRNELSINDEDLDVSTEMQKYLMQQHIDSKIVDVLKGLKKKYFLFIVTARRDNFLKEFLLKEGVIDLFTDLLGSSTQIKKEIKFTILLKNYNLKAGEIVFVTDTLGDILEAHKAGICTIAVDFGFHERARLERGKPFAIISSFDELEPTILKIK